MFELQQSINGFANLCGLKIADPEGVRGVGFHRLSFPTTFTYHATESQVQFSGLMAEVSLGGAPLGRCVLPAGALPGRLQKGGGSHAVATYLDLTNSQLKAIEDARLGGNLTLQMNAWLQFVGLQGYGDTPIWQSFSGPSEIPQSVWINKVLAKLAYDDYLLLEVPLSTHPKDAALSRAVGHLRKARDFASKGDYQQSVAECRDAMNEIEAVYGLTPAERAGLAAYSAGDRKRAEKLDKASRFAVWRNGLINVVHAAHHKEEGHDAWEWGRAGAMAVMTATAAMIEASYSPDARDSAGPKAVLAAAKAARASQEKAASEEAKDA